MNIFLHRFSLNQPESAIRSLYSFLSSGEKIRASRFVFQKDKDNYIISRGMLRSLLAHYLNCEPTSIEIVTTEMGKPHTRPQQIHFNLSHSGGYVLYSFCQERDIGIDLEYCCKDMEIGDLARHYFHPKEIEQLDKCSSSVDKEKKFFSYWTRKEAYLKAVGLGIGSCHLFSLNMSSTPSYLPCSMDSFPYWKIISLPLLENYASALAFPVKSTEEEITISPLLI